MVKRSLAVILGLVAATATTAARANPLETLGFGSREIALGGAVSADIEDPTATFYNPAGLARGSQLRIAAGYMRLQSALEIDEQSSVVDPIAGMNLGIVAPLEIGPTRIAFGLGVHLPDQRISRTRSVLLDHPRWELYDTRPHKIFLSTALAFEPTRYLRFGGGITFQSPAQLALTLRGNADFSSPEASALEHEFRGNLLSVRYPHAGVQIDLMDELAFGLSYRGRLRIATQLEATVDGDIVGIGAPVPVDFSLRNQGVTAYFPQQIVLSLAARPIPALRIGFDLTFMDWSGHPSLIANDEVSLSLMLPPGLGISLPSEIRGRKPIPMHMHDRWVPRIGVEYSAVDSSRYGVDLRAGYVLERSPFPVQSGATNFVDNTRHSMSLGAGLEFRDLEPTLDGSVRIDAHFLYAYLPERVHQKSSPIDPVGDYTSRGHQFGFGLQAEVLFE